MSKHDFVAAHRALHPRRTLLADCHTAGTSAAAPRAQIKNSLALASTAPSDDGSACRVASTSPTPGFHMISPLLLLRLPTGRPALNWLPAVLALANR